MRVKVTLACLECRNRAYDTTRNKAKERLEMKKYCRFCRKHTLQRETK
ncbi:MAG: 50S ribosomal protein L33 [Oscillospiraceae bacterium]|nr:50S ribosomal protein L33 [Oscillospiraceae bacterium]